MEVNLTPEMEAKLKQAAIERGCDAHALVHEAVEHWLAAGRDYDMWFARQIEEGLAAADRGELIDHEDVSRILANTLSR